MTPVPDASTPRVQLTPVDFDPFAADGLAAILPLTEAQQEMWGAVQMGREASCSYNQRYAVRLRGNLDVDALRSAIQRLLDRHEALRVTFSPDGDWQSVVPAMAVEVPLVDLSTRPAEVRDREVAGLLEQEGDEPFDLVSGPLLRARVVKEATDCHLLVLTVHHIVCDGWSAGILLRDLGALYGAARRASGAEPPETAQYSEHVRRQSDQLNGSEAKAAEAYWLGQLAGPVPVLELPLDRPRPQLKTYAGSQENLTIGASLYRDLKRVGARHGATLYVTVLATWQALFHRLTGQTDFVLGIPVAGQAVLDNENLVGHFVNTLPLRSRIEPDAPFAQHLRAVRQGLLEAYEHQTLTFGSLVRKLQSPRDLSRTPLVAVLFNLDKVGAQPQFDGLAVEVLIPPKRFVNFELDLNLVDTGECLVAECSYNTDLFEPRTIRRWLGHFQVLLEGVVADPERRLWELPLLTGPEREQLLVEWNDTASAALGEERVHRLFEAQVDRTPDVVALAFQGTSLSYRELDRRANQMAWHLRALGVGPEAPVGLCLTRSPDMVVALLGILKAGAAYLPLDPSYPLERLTFMVQDARPSVIVADSPALASHDGGPTVLRLDAGGDREAIARQPSDRPDAPVAADDLAYVIYTSGSTGRPKGVMLEHRNVANLFVGMDAWVGTGPGVWLALTSLSFDISVVELLWTLARGFTVVLHPGVGAAAPLAAGEGGVGTGADGSADSVAEQIVRYGVTHVQCTPSLARMLAQDPESLRALHSLRTLLVGGEALAPDLASLLIRHASVELLNMYGPTETTVWSAVHRVQAADGPIPIGRPVANTELYVLDPHQQPAPVGVAGELYIGGAGVARGYLHRAELTAERFLPDPFSSTPAARMYRTGDLARWLPDGTVDFLGRVDHQLKIRGHRVEPGEIEARLLEHPGVREAVVIAREGSAGDVRLVGYVVPRAGATLAGDAVRDHLKQRLPDVMVPTHLVVLEALPLTPNGKVDRKALPPPELAGPGRPHAPVRPRTRSEEIVAATWAAALGLGAVGVDDNFFDLGGHSIAAAQIMARLRQAFAVEVPLRALFEAPTVAGLTHLLEALLWAANAARPVASEEGREDIEL